MMLLWLCCGAEGESLPVVHEVPDADECSEAELDGEERDDEAFAPWRVDARRAGDAGHV